MCSKNVKLVALLALTCFFYLAYLKSGGQAQREFEYIIKQAVFASELTVFLVAVHTAPDYFERRKLIRITWGSSGLFPNRILLLLERHSVTAAINKGSLSHNEILHVGFRDSKLNSKSDCMVALDPRVLS